MHSQEQVVHSTPAKNHRFHLLDAMRGIVAVLVVVYHLPAAWRPLLPLPNGYLAVDFFFCLSGFVVAFAYERRLRENMRLRDFAAARLIRLYPLYLLGTLLGILVSLLVAHAASNPMVSKLDVVLVFLFGLFLIPNFFVHWIFTCSFPLNLPSWSLFYELAANLAFAALSFRTHIRKSLLLGICVVTIAGLLLAVSKGYPNLDFGSYPNTFFPGFARVGYSFFCGILILRAYGIAGRQRFRGIADVAVSTLAILALLTILLASFGPVRTLTFQFLAVVLLLPAIVYLGACTTLHRRWHRLCGTLGDLSYPIYILHYPLILLFTGRKMRTFNVHHPHLSFLLLPGVCLLVIGVAFYSGEFYDRPVRRWLTRWYNHKTQTVPAAPTLPRDIETKVHQHTS